MHPRRGGHASGPRQHRAWCLKYHSEAAAELAQTARFYEARETGLGARFLERVEDATRSIQRRPTTWPRDSAGRHRFHIRGFPSLLIYRVVSSGGDYLLAVAHTSRKPGYWTPRDPGAAP